MEYKKITFEQAFAMMESMKEDEYVFIDIRRPDEFNAGHIKNSILLTDYEIIDRMENEYPNKDITVFIYCRTGRRTIAASLILMDLGYTVYDVGGIYDLPKDFEFEQIE